VEIQVTADRRLRRVGDQRLEVPAHDREVAPRSATVRPLMTSIPDTSKGPPPCFRRPRKIQEDSEKTPFEDPEER
jgi:hypothetical protein